MKNVSELYKRLRQDQRSKYEVRITRGSTTYGMESIVSCRLLPALFYESGPKIGGVTAQQCNITLREDTSSWPRMASFVLQVRLHDWQNIEVSEWVTLGEFYTDERSESESGNLSIIAYDSMLLLETSWTDKIQNPPATWPITEYQAAQLLQEATGVLIDSRVVLDDTVPYIGLDTTSSARSVYSSIAVANGGNWVITSENKLYLHRFVNIDTSQSALAGIAIVGIAIVGSIGAPSTGNVDVYNLNRSVVSLDVGEALQPVTGVKITNSKGVEAVAGTSSGYVIHAECEFADTNIAQLCLSRIQGYVYKPFQAIGGLLDPIVELGDYVIIDKEAYPIITMDWSLGAHIVCALSAPVDKAVDHEYSPKSKMGLFYQKTTEEMAALEERVYSSIQQSASQIMTQVSETYVTQSDVASDINTLSAEVDQKIVTLQTTVTQTTDALEVEIQDVTEDYDELRIHYRFDAEGETIGKSNSSKKVRLSNDGIDMLVNDDSITHWTQDEMYTPRKVHVPTEGSLQLGTFILQPRSSGNVSLLFIGD